MQVVIPSVFQTTSLLDMMGEPRLPVLDNLLARGRQLACQPANLVDWLGRELCIAHQHDTPIAAICLAEDGLDPGHGFWLRADPVHVRVARDQLILSNMTDLSHDEAEQLRQDLVAHFGEDFSPVVTHTGTWFVEVNRHTGISTTALPSAIGKHIDPLLPAGKDALHWRKLLNEIQMLLFDHPVNQAREARGLPTANSLWLWGGGSLPAVPHISMKPAIMTSHPLALTLTKFAGASLLPMQAAWQSSQTSAPNSSNLFIFDQPHTALQQGDLAAWLDAIRALENNWLKPLYHSKLHFDLIDPEAGKILGWNSLDRWKFWRKPEKIRQQTLELSAPDAGSTQLAHVDEFGNRF